MRILGIETSCDETAAAVLEVKNGRFSVLSNVVASQIKIHAKTGGVVPEVAAREHAKAILTVVKMAIQNSKLKTQNLGKNIDAIAVTAGPGLITSLLVGVETARTLSYLWKKPLVAVNHLEGHVYANWLLHPCHSGLEPESRKQELLDSRWSLPRTTMRGGNDNKKFPILCLIVSGGHTELVLMRNCLDYKIIGATRDDAAGECFDKAAKILGLGYPGGPAVSAEAAKLKTQNSKLKTMVFPRPMINSPDFDFSFSGLKTAVLYYVKSQKDKKIKKHLPEICYEVQEAIVDVLVAKTIAAAKKYKVKTVMLGGGVAANKRLREQLKKAVQKEIPTTNYSLPNLQYTTDNAAMIAAAGYWRALKKDFTPWQKLEADPNWQIGGKMRISLF
ncbi:MAG: tRNA (adenosine(37)-N6)-threonylcarbamoyltransferase complex transferase subunit TsaD [bacterium]|nr:tRNA (adenosine(37)-N6)-threonylcarbamoyltransferase complex transferase subunit TsaD [bacterium]